MITNIIINIAGFFILLLTVLSQAELWQRKEYRLDRLKSYFKDKEWLSQPWKILVMSFLLFILASITYYFQLSLHVLLANITLLLLAAYHANRIWKRGVYRPKRTLKSTLILIVALALIVIVPFPAYLNYENPALLWNILIFAVLPVSAFSTFFINLLSNARKKSIINHAKSILRGNNHLITVGITGSFGKTSTKHFLHQILSSAGVSHLISPAHHNDLLPIARDIIARLSPQHKVYISEMGAYRKGEISALADLIKPSVGAVTAISNQHLSLFGSIENLADAKWELVNSLPKNGVAILNADDPVIAKRSAATNQSIIWYSNQEKKNVWASNVTINNNKINATINIGKHAKDLELNVVGPGALSNILCASAIAYALNVPPQEILSSLTLIKPVDRTMQILRGLANSIVIDDSYSANEQGVISAIDHLELYKNHNKIIVLSPLIELGSEAAPVHVRIGEKLARSKAKVYISGNLYQNQLQQAFLGNQEKSIQFINSPAKLSRVLTDQLTDNTVILIEGRIPDTVRQSILNTKSSK